MTLFRDASRGMEDVRKGQFMKKTSVFLYLIVACAFFGKNLQAQSIVDEDDRYFYITTSWKEWTLKERQLVVERAAEVLSNKLRDIAEDFGMTSTNDDDFNKIDMVLNQADEKFDDLKSTMQKYLDKDPNRGIKLGKINLSLAALPTAFFLVAGGKFTVNWKLGGGGSVNLGFTFLPQKVIQIDKVSGNIVDRYYALDVGYSIMGAGNFGGGAGGGPRGRVGLGFLWGPLADADHFNGLALGASKTFALGGGINGKIGLLVQTKNVVVPVAVNPYVVAAAEFGGVATAELHGNLMPISSLSSVVKKVFGAEFERVILGDLEESVSFLE